MEITIADWVIVGATVVSAIATAVSTIVAVRLARIVINDRQVPHMQHHARSATSEVMGIPIHHVQIENWPQVPR